MKKLTPEALCRFVLLLAFQSPLASSVFAVDDSARQRGKAESMVIVAPERFHHELTRFRDYRAEQRPTELLSLESILKRTQGVDDPERLKRWLYQSWKVRNLRYVL